MPSYLYSCQECNEEFEEFHSINTQLEECPKCKANNKPPVAPTRLIASGGTFILNSGGVGWSNTGYS